MRGSGASLGTLVVLFQPNLSGHYLQALLCNAASCHVVTLCFLLHHIAPHHHLMDLCVSWSLLSPYLVDHSYMFLLVLHHVN